MSFDSDLTELVLLLVAVCDAGKPGLGLSIASVGS